MTRQHVDNLQRRPLRLYYKYDERSAVEPLFVVIVLIASECAAVYYVRMRRTVIENEKAT